MMKRRIGVFILLLFASSFVFAMDDPILVKTSPGNYVKIYAWPSSGGPLLNLGEGSVNNEGLFSHTFFSLHEPTIKYQVLIIKNGEKIIDESFDNGKTFLIKIKQIWEYLFEFTLSDINMITET